MKKSEITEGVRRLFLEAAEKVPTLKQIRVIDVTGKEWFDRSAANSYCSAQIYIVTKNGKEFTYYVPFQYGYGDFYKQAAAAELIKLGIIEKGESLRTLREAGIIVRSDIHTGKKKAEVQAWGQE